MAKQNKNTTNSVQKAFNFKLKRAFFYILRYLIDIINTVNIFACFFSFINHKNQHCNVHTQML